MDPAERITALAAKVATLEELLLVHERTVVSESRRLSQGLKECLRLSDGPG